MKPYSCTAITCVVAITFLVVLHQVHGEKVNRFGEKSTVELLKALIQASSNAEAASFVSEVVVQDVSTQAEFSLSVDGCGDSITDEIKSSLSNYLKRFLSGKQVTLSCGKETSVASGAGLTYTRWGHKACPSVSGTELLYSGRLAGVFYNQRGGGSNYLCLPDDPEYDTLKTDFTKDYSRIYGTEYEYPLVGAHDHGVPCAVCYASTRSAELMIPAKTSCPPNWTREYFGYIMADGNFGDRSRNEYICVDKDQISLPGSIGNQNGNLLYHVRATCHGIQCPPYNSQKALTCSVCTK